MNGSAPIRYEFLQFRHRPVRTEACLMIESTCTACDESKLVSFRDGSMEQWEHDHQCEKVTDGVQESTEKRISQVAVEEQMVTKKTGGESMRTDQPEIRLIFILFPLVAAYFSIAYFATVHRSFILMALLLLVSPAMFVSLWLIILTLRTPSER